MENLPLPLHLLLHFVLAVLAGWLVGRRFDKTALGIVAGILGGFFIDLDHVLEYFLVLGPHFNIVYFLEGRQYLTSSQVHSWFHAWEYVPPLLFLVWLLRKHVAGAVFVLALTLGGAVHLATDSVVNQYPVRNYSLIYRWRSNFAVEKLLNPAQYREFMEDKAHFDL